MNSGNLCKSALLCILMMLAAMSAAAQQPAPDCTAIYGKFLAAKKGPELTKLRAALTAGKEYLEKCASDPDQEKVTTYVTNQIPPLTEKIKILEIEERFNKATETDNKDEIVVSGKDLLERNHPASLDIMIVLASVGYSKAAASSPVDTMNEDTLRYARSVIDKISSGAKSETYGAYKYHYKTNACKDGAANTIGWMNLTIGYVLGGRQKKTKDALPYYYKAVQTGCETKDSPEIYRSIAGWYIDEEKKIEAVLIEKLKDSNDVETDETKALDALANGYLDRAIDAYARAYKSADAKAGLPQASKDSYSNRLKEVYEARFHGKMDGFDQYLAKISGTPFPDPTSEVKPAPVEMVKPADPPPAQPAAKTAAKPVKKTPAKPAKAAPKNARKKIK